MIDTAFKIIQKKLQSFVGQDAKIGQLSASSSGESIGFPEGQITPILINIEQENTLRAADRHSRISPMGIRQPIQPDIHVNLYILFVSHFEDYLTSLHHLGEVLKCFQASPLLNQENLPSVKFTEIDHLILELVSLPLAEQNEVWNALRSAYKPSLLYRVRMLAFMTAPGEPAQEVQEIEISMEHQDKSL